MKHFKYIFSFFLSIIIFNSCSKVQRNNEPKELKGGFELLSVEETGIDFNNSIKETKHFNHYFYSQMYVGSGVAIGDINNDGLADVFFGGNQVGDKLYLNKGGFKFEDISKTSKISRNPGWSWGVTMADVNADGYLDIYVSRNGNSLDLKKRKNLLFINNQDLTFTESADSYGLADNGFSTQSVFFDLDNDGDLDMYQVNQLADKKVMLINKITPKDVESFKDRLYRNDNGKFIDVSKEVGISRDIAYGLSVNAADFNDDGFTDLYVANDYSEPDFLYYNNGDGTFTNVINEKMKHITQNSMGSDTGDVNNDGFLDLFTTDMTPEDHYRSKTNMASMSSEKFNELVKAGAHHQYMANALQINTGLGSFSDVANVAGVSYTDWSWASLLVDLDNDSWKDIIVTNGIKKDVDNNDYLKVLQGIDVKNITYDKLFKISKEAPSQAISNYVFKNKGNLKFEKKTKNWGFDTPSFSSGMAYGDLDNDGDLDIVTNNMDAPAFIYKNKANGNFLKIKLEGSEKNKFGFGTKVKIYYENNTQFAEHNVTRGFLSSVEPGLFFGLGKHKNVDKIEITWYDGKTSEFSNISVNKTIVAKYDNANRSVLKSENIAPKILKVINTESIGLNFKHKENEFNEFKEEILLPHNISQNGPFTTVGDINNDGFEDVFVGGAVGQSGVLYIQNVNGKFNTSTSQPWEADLLSEDLEAHFFDADNDNDLDLYIASGGSEYKQGNKKLKDRLYINDGKGTFRKDNAALPNIYESSQAISFSDIDNDGDIDIFVGTRLISQKYLQPATSYFLINNNGKFKKASKETAPSLIEIGMVTDAVFTDIDNDKDEDLIVVGEWMPIMVLTNENGIFNDVSDNYFKDNSRGIWWSITANDIDNDGDDDYIIGNLGLNNKFKASKEHPLKIYGSDFDNNGTNDVVLAKYYSKQGDYVPVRGRECTSQQMPYVLDKFKDYHSFASSKLLDILPKDKVEDAVVYEIQNFESIILINDNGKLKSQSLPIQAQLSPVKSSVVDDFNKDGFKDLLFVGNHYGVEVETVRYDAGYGSLLLGDGNNNFIFAPPATSGLHIPKDSRSVKLLKSNKDQQNLILVTNNNDSLVVLKNN